MENKHPQAILMPLDVSSRVGFFDRLAGRVADISSRAPFFAFVHYHEALRPIGPPAPYDRTFMPASLSAAAARDANQANGATVRPVTADEHAVLTALHDGALRYLDMRLKQIADALTLAGSWDQTLLVVTAGRGEDLGEAGRLGGMPPLAGFFGKFFVFAAAVEAGLIWLAVIGVLNAIIGLYYYLTVLKVVYLYRSERDNERIPVSRPYAVALALCSAGILVLGTLAAPWWGWATVAAQGLF